MDAMKASRRQCVLYIMLISCCCRRMRTVRAGACGRGQPDWRGHSPRGRQRHNSGKLLDSAKYPGNIHDS
eukprot:365412-Chlamydomonas_euryale.AAC.12